MIQVALFGVSDDLDGHAERVEDMGAGGTGRFFGQQGADDRKRSQQQQNACAKQRCHAVRNQNAQQGARADRKGCKGGGEQRNSRFCRGTDFDPAQAERKTGGKAVGTQGKRGKA